MIYYLLCIILRYVGMLRGVSPIRDPKNQWLESQVATWWRFGDLRDGLGINTINGNMNSTKISDK